MFYLPDCGALCVYSQAHSRSDTPPMYRSMEPTSRPPIDRVQVERPRSPSGASPVFGRRCAGTASHGRGVPCRRGRRRVLRPRPDAARRRLRARPSRRRCGLPGSRRAASRASGCCTACSTASARRCRRWRSPARPPPSPRAARGRRCAPPARRRPRRWRRWSSRSPGRCFAEHRAAGRPLVLATTTPYDLVKPLADRLGLDDVIATRYGVNADGTYDGTIVGPFVWAAGKLAAVRDWAARARRRPRRELRLLRQLLRHPAAVGGRARRSWSTPIRGMVVMATVRRWPILNLDVSPGVVKIPVLGIELQQAGAAVRPPRADAVRPLRHRRGRAHPGRRARRSSSPTTAATSTRRRCPWSSPAAAAPCASSARRRCSTCRSSASWPTAMGGIRVDRASGSDEPLQAAADALDGGEVVAIMPQGTIPRGPAFFDPELKGRWGAARLAQLTKAPVIPIGLWGTERVWPRSSRLPNVLNVADPPTVTRPRRSAGRAEVPLARRRHQADHGGDHRPAARRGRAAPHTRRPRSWPPPTRPATAASPAPSTSAVRAPTSARSSSAG